MLSDVALVFVCSLIIIASNIGIVVAVAGAADVVIIVVVGIVIIIISSSLSSFLTFVSLVWGLGSFWSRVCFFFVVSSFFFI